MGKCEVICPNRLLPALVWIAGCQSYPTLITPSDPYQAEDAKELRQVYVDIPYSTLYPL